MASFNVGAWRLGDDGSIYRKSRLRYANGDVYDGEWVDGKRHGKGMFTFKHGTCSYVGEFYENFYHGFGILTSTRTQHPLTKKWISGEKYEGDFQMGKKHGKGTSRSSNGERYDGMFHNGYYHGRGTCAYRNGDVYEGEWVHGKWQGSGEWRCHQDGSIYRGDFLNGLFHGFGTYLYGPNGTHGRYTGHYRYGARHGKGRREYGEGLARKVYEGDWVDDEIHGVGIFETPQYKYVGEFQNGKMDGHGAMTMTNGDAYEGEFKHGHKHGQGIYTYRDGGSYTGGWIESKRHGQGIRTFSNGDVYNGDWIDDVMHGHGVLERITKVPGKKKNKSETFVNTTLYRYDGDFMNGHQTGKAVIYYTYTPHNADTLFEWTHEYEFPLKSGFWHSGRGQSIYKGTVERGEFHGDNGELVSPDGKRWYGTWNHNQLNGPHCEVVVYPLLAKQWSEHERLPLETKQKLMTQTRGLYRMVQYKGCMEGNVRHGDGKMLLENGDWIQGQFIHGMVDGLVKYTFSTGKDRYGMYHKGTRLYWLDEEEERNLRAQEQALHDEAVAFVQQSHSVIRALMA